ncbi:hypothetical protein HDU91_004064, partial [Kappamyces sp. JEL0680]
MLAQTVLLAASLLAKTATVTFAPDVNATAAVVGTLKLVQATEKDIVSIAIDVTGLAPNSTHGWH